MEEGIQSIISPSQRQRQAIIREQFRTEGVDLSQKDSDIAFLIELAAAAFFGMMGIGYLYSGLSTLGLTRLIGYWAVWLGLLVMFFFCGSIFPPIWCLIIFLIPLHFVLAFLSANDLKKAMQSTDGAPAASDPLGDSPTADPFADLQRDLALDRGDEALFGDLMEADDDGVAAPASPPESLAEMGMTIEERFSERAADAPRTDLDFDMGRSGEADVETVREAFELPSAEAWGVVEDGDKERGAIDTEAVKESLAQHGVDHPVRREIDRAEEMDAEIETIQEAFEAPNRPVVSVAEDGDKDSGIDVESVRAALRDAASQHGAEPATPENETPDDEEDAHHL
ncbi:MAG: hypothetical protein KDD73_09195 [Anaerolineales bacterium]|nr:hypothetical protein [Anaerolineales bacterium]